MADHPLSETVEDLTSSIDELEDVLGPLLSTPLPELSGQLSRPLERAKLQVWLAYVLNDLIWIHLRTRGINPNNLGGGEVHNVVSELDRVKAYFAKIKEAEDPAKRTLAVDGKVANRFIKHALSSAISPANFAPKPTHVRFDEDGDVTREVQAPDVVESSKTEPEPAAATGSSSDDEEPKPGTWKAKKRAREVDLARQRAGEGSDDEPMTGWEDPSEEISTSIPQEVNPPANSPGRTKRPRMDPFAGYDGPSTRSGKLQLADGLSQSKSESKTSKPESNSQSSPSPSTSSSASASGTVRRRKSRRGTRGGKRAKRTSETSDAPKRHGLAREALERAATKQ